MSKTQKYWVVIIILLIANLSLYFSDQLFKAAEVDSSYFDPNLGQIKSITIEQSNDTIFLERNKQWLRHLHRKLLLQMSHLQAF